MARNPFPRAIGDFPGECCPSEEERPYECVDQSQIDLIKKKAKIHQKCGGQGVRRRLR